MSEPNRIMTLSQPLPMGWIPRDAYWGNCDRTSDRTSAVSMRTSAGGVPTGLSDIQAAVLASVVACRAECRLCNRRTLSDWPSRMAVQNALPPDSVVV